MKAILVSLRRTITDIAQAPVNLTSEQVKIISNAMEGVRDKIPGFSNDDVRTVLVHGTDDELLDFLYACQGECLDDLVLAKTVINGGSLSWLNLVSATGQNGFYHHEIFIGCIRSLRLLRVCVGSKVNPPLANQIFINSITSALRSKNGYELATRRPFYSADGPYREVEDLHPLREKAVKKAIGNYFDRRDDAKEVSYPLVLAVFDRLKDGSAKLSALAKAVLDGLAFSIFRNLSSQERFEALKSVL